MKKIQIMFWKFVACFWDFRPRLHLPRFSDYPIASTDIAPSYDYEDFKNFRILFEWDEKGRHYIVFTR